MLRRNPYTFIGVVAIIIAALAIYFSIDLDIPIRDPEGFLGPSYIRLPAIGVLIFAAFLIPQAIIRYGHRNIPRSVRLVIRNEWTWGRLGYVAAGFVAFYTCYVSYRNLKSYLPELRPPTFDLELEKLDHWLFFGNYPSDLLHSLLGTGIAAQVLSVIYLTYLMAIPVTLGAYLVLSRDVSIGAWYATALGLNWVLGTLSYYILPTVGPAFAYPTRFEEIDVNGATELQRSLFRAGRDFIENDQSTSIYGIAGFASLHVSVVFTVCLFLHLTKAPQILRVIAWLYMLGTLLATVYFGWHYVADDVAGLLIGWAAVAVGAWATGNTKRQKRQSAEAAASPEALGAAVAAEAAEARADENDPETDHSVKAP